LITLVNGRLQTAQNGSVAPLGFVSFSLTVDAQVIAAPYGQVMAGATVIMFFDSSGNIITTGGVNKLWSNAELNPQITGFVGTAYLVNFYDVNGARVNRSPQIWVFTQLNGAVVDIGTMQPIGLPVVYYANIGGGGGGAVADTVVPYSTSQTITALGVGINQFSPCTAGAGGIALVLPTAVGVGGQRIRLIKIDSAAGAVAITGGIEGEVDLGNQYQYVDFESDNAVWWVMGNN
jgi:hypothetical protein